MTGLHDTMRARLCLQAHPTHAMSQILVLLVLWHLLEKGPRLT